MVASKRKHKRRSSMMIVFLPAVLFIFLLGWCTYCIGDQKRPNKIQHKPRKEDKDNVTIMPIVYEETQEIINE